ncbi:hypothetical protein [Blastococcus saxobsidens]|uniref:hypothetical protein n=1 Tax=Blastococcus saxobsidens TaxID=138336 RepID=UPI00102BB6A0|nr:hypothetical protein [Blastococcus saxobsidens]
MRSVEAATRDDAIAAAREQFGPHARVVGVRRVRSGGVLGFFATERYVAEVADQFGRPGLPTPSTGPAPAAPVASYDSPLASASPARAAAPARNGAAAWAAEAARSGGAPATGPRPAARPARPADDDDRLDELAGLLGAVPTPRPATAPARQPASAHQPPRSAAPARAASAYGAAPAADPVTDGGAFPRAAFPRASRPSTAPRERVHVEPAAPVEAAAVPGSPFAAALAAAEASDAPSPFTAALARMVAGDRDVRHAVEQALDEPVARPVDEAALRPVEEPASRPIEEPAPRPRQKQLVQMPDTPAPRPSLAAAIRSADTSMRSKAVHQEETTVGEQVVTPPSTSTDGPVGVPTWAAQPESVAPAASARQEEIAEALRSALAQGHSDEALAGILRKMLAGDSPQEAIAEPPAAVIAESPAPVVAASPAVEPARAAEPATTAEPVVSVAEPVVATAEPVVEPLAQPTPVVTAAPAPLIAQVAAGWDSRTSNHSLFGTSAVAPSTTDLGWGTPVPAPTPSYSPLWGEPVVEETVPVDRADAPIWADIVLRDPAPAPAGAVQVVEESVAVEPEAAEAPAAPEAEAVEVEAVEVEAVEVEVVEVEVVEAEVDEAVEAGVDEAEDVVAPAEQLATPAPSAPAAELFVAGTAPERAPEPAVAQAETVAPEPQPEADARPAAAEVARTREANETAVAEAVAELAPMLARTASDPAPMTMSLDATTVMPRVSLLPPLAGSRGRGLPPVPPSSGRPAVPPSRPAAPAAEPAETAEAGDRAEAPAVDEKAAVSEKPVAAEKPRTAAPAMRSLATVTRLPVAPLMAGPDLPEMPELDDEQPATERATAPAPGGTPRTAASTPQEVLAGLVALGLPEFLLGTGFTAAVAADGTYAALTQALAAGLPEVPQVPTGAGEVLFIVGPGVETLRAARSLAASLRLDPDRVQWATRGDLAGLAPKASRMTTIDAAIDRRQEAANASTLTIVAVDAPLRSDAYWMAQMLAIWSPVAVWAVVEATRKPEDLELWLDGLARVDALAVQDTDLSADPAAVLRRLTVPVALLDGVRATPHRWASLLCERLDSPQA